MWCQAVTHNCDLPPRAWPQHKSDLSFRTLENDHTPNSRHVLQLPPLHTSLFSITSSTTTVHLLTSPEALLEITMPTRSMAKRNAEVLLDGPEAGSTKKLRRASSVSLSSLTSDSTYSDSASIFSDSDSNLDSTSSAASSVVGKSLASTTSMERSPISTTSIEIPPPPTSGMTKEERSERLRLRSLLMKDVHSDVLVAMGREQLKASLIAKGITVCMWNSLVLTAVVHAN
jgi:hypothetical protein